eukprot:3782787-Rhodomonas_salina.1
MHTHARAQTLQHSSTPHSALHTQHLALSTQHSALHTQHSALCTHPTPACIHMHDTTPSAQVRVLPARSCSPSSCACTLENENLHAVLDVSVSRPAPAYARAMWFLVLTRQFVLHACYAMSGTDGAYGGIRLLVAHPFERGQKLHWVAIPCSYWLSSCASAMPCRTSMTIILCFRYAMSGTDEGYAATRRPGLQQLGAYARRCDFIFTFERWPLSRGPWGHTGVGRSPVAKLTSWGCRCEINAFSVRRVPGMPLLAFDFAACIQYGVWTDVGLAGTTATARCESLEVLDVHANLLSPHEAQKCLPAGLGIEIHLT